LPKPRRQGAFEWFHHHVINVSGWRPLMAGFYHGINRVLKPREKGFNTAVGVIADPAI
jgi:hypothetical protein